MPKIKIFVCAAMALAVVASTTGRSRAALVTLSDPSGLSAEAEFTLLGPTTLEVRLRNTSTGVPMGFSNSDQLLTSVAFDLGGPSILGGAVLTGPTSSSVNFDVASVGPNANVSGEYGFGNGGTTGLFDNYISANTAGTDPFGGVNLDGPVSLDGPQAGLVADPILVPIGGLGAIQYEIVATLSLSDPLADLGFLANRVTVEFGSDAAFITSPEPSAPALVGIAAAVLGWSVSRGKRRGR